MSKLLAVAPDSIKVKRPTILIYGRPGVGKTWAAIDFPSTYFIDTEQGATQPHYVQKLKQAGAAYLGSQQGSTDFNEVIEQVKALLTEKHNYKTLVIDSISKLFNAAIAAEAERLLVARKANEYGADRKPAVKAIQRLIALFDKLDMTVILIAHQKDEYGIEGGERKVIGTTFDCWEKLAYELGLTLEISKQGASRYATVKKTRLEPFPDSEKFEWSYDSFAQKYGKDALEADHTQTELATAEQIKKVQDLMYSLESPNETDPQYIWLKENLNALEEVESEKMEKIIIYLTNQIN